MALRDPSFLDSKTYGFEWLRLAAELALQEGVIDAGDFKVTAAAAGGLRVDVAAGTALVKGDTGTPGTGRSHGLYTVVNDAAVANAVTFGAAHATLPRLDQVCLRVNDSSDLGSAANNAELIAVAGTATSGATLDNRSGAAALPSNAIRLADVLIPAAATAVTAGNVRDRRPWARGITARAETSRNNSDIGLPPPPSLQEVLAIDVECSGRPVMLGATFSEYVAANGVTFQYEFRQDGASIAGSRQQNYRTTANVFADHSPSWAAVPSAGRHRFTFCAGTAATSTGSIVNRSDIGAQMTVRELASEFAINA